MNPMDPRSGEDYERMIRRNDPAFRRWMEGYADFVATLPERVSERIDAAAYADLFARITVAEPERHAEVRSQTWAPGRTLGECAESLFFRALGGYGLGGELGWRRERLAWGVWLVADPPSAEAAERGWCSAQGAVDALDGRVFALPAFGPPPTAAELDAGWRYEEPPEVTYEGRHVVVYRDGPEVVPAAERDRERCRRDNIGTEWLPVGKPFEPPDPDDARREAEAYWRGEHEEQGSVEAYVRAYRRGDAPSFEEISAVGEVGDAAFEKEMARQHVALIRKGVRSGDTSEAEGRESLSILKLLGHDDREIEDVRTLMREHGLDV